MDQIIGFIKGNYSFLIEFYNSIDPDLIDINIGIFWLIWIILIFLSIFFYIFPFIITKIMWPIEWFYKKILYVYFVEVVQNRVKKERLEDINFETFKRRMRFNPLEFWKLIIWSIKNYKIVKKGN